MAVASQRVPGVYRWPQPRKAVAPRVRMDVVGMVGFAGPGPAHEAIAFEDWRSYRDYFLRDARGRERRAPAGSKLSQCVHAFFANGGARCWVVNIGEPSGGSSAVQLEVMFGDQPPPGALKYRGLERLLLEEEVSVVLLPELDAEVAVREALPAPELLDEGQSRFGPCRPSGLAATGQVRDAVDRRLFTDQEVLDAQRRLLARLARERWRWFAVLSPPPGQDPGRAKAWRSALTASVGDDVDYAALYWPWVLAQDTPDEPVSLRSPIGYVAGVFARRARSEGAHAAPANETVYGVVGTESEVDDRINEDVYEVGINPLRAFGGYGIQVWGARTLRWLSIEDTNRPLAYVSARRGLSAIQRAAQQIGRTLVFEPNQPLLWARLGQAIMGHLLEVFEVGALRGVTPQESFFVQCDSSLNDEATVRAGQVVCQVGVALSAPAEFIVFRLGRRDGVIEIEEV